MYASAIGGGNEVALGQQAAGNIWVVDEPSMYKITDSGSQLESFSLSQDIYGVGLDSQGCIWGAYRNGSTVYKYTQNGSAIDSFSTSGELFGLDVDTDDCIWFGLYSMYQTTQSGSVLDSFYALPFQTAVGIGNDNCLWLSYTSTFTDSNYFSKFTQGGSEIQKSYVVGYYPYGADLNSSGSIWFTDDVNDSIYKMDDNASIITSITAPSVNPFLRGLGIE